jgi:hypothetical protein
MIMKKERNNRGEVVPLLGWSTSPSVFQVLALQDVDSEVYPGEVVALRARTGPKTTLLRF